jgi:Rdx family
MLQVENEKVFIEHCQACSDHAWCTKHDESKYKSYFESCKGKILVSCPEVQVVANQIPLAFNSKFSEASKPWEGRHSYPRIGAFEIYFKDKIIFSKLESGLWPQSTIVADKIREILDQSKLPSKPREANNPEVLKKRNKNKIAPRYIKSIEPVSSRKETNRGKSFTPQRRVEAESYRTDLSEYKKNEKKDYSAREGKTDNEDSDDFKEDFSQLKKKFKDKSIEKTREITKVYELSLPGNCLSNKVLTI